MGDCTKLPPLPSEEDLSCEVQRTVDEAEENLQNALEDHEDFLKQCFRHAANSVCRLASGQTGEARYLAFQEAATAIAKMFRGVSTSRRKLVDLANRCGRCQRSRELYDAYRKAGPLPHKPFLRRSEVLSIAVCQLSSASVAPANPLYSGRASPVSPPARTTTTTPALMETPASPPMMSPACLPLCPPPTHGMSDSSHSPPLSPSPESPPSVTQPSTADITDWGHVLTPPRVASCSGGGGSRQHHESGPSSRQHGHSTWRCHPSTPEDILHVDTMSLTSLKRPHWSYDDEDDDLLAFPNLTEALGDLSPKRRRPS